MNSFIEVLCWLGVFQSLLLSFYFLSAGNQSKGQVFLGFTMLMVALRAAKSTLYLFNSETPFWVINVGFAAHASIGPLVLLYIKTLGTSFRWTNWALLNFIPPTIIIGLANYLTLDSFWYKGGYEGLLYITLVYNMQYGLLYIKLYRSDQLNPDIKNQWINVLLITLTLFQLSYFSNYILRLTEYSTGPLAYSIMIYLISFVVIRNNQSFKAERRKKYFNINQTEDEIAYNLDLLRQLMETQKPYIDFEFSLQKLADLSKLPSHLLSHTFSSSTHKSFTHFTNSYRIRDAEEMLADTRNNKLTIAAIAFACGFNSLSVFNTAFKRINGQTPSSFRRSIQR